MINSDHFLCLINDFIKKDGSIYQTEIKRYESFLKDRLLLEEAFNLKTNNIDEFFKYCMVDNIGSIPSLTRNISALKAFFQYLINNNLPFESLNGHISNPSFKDKLSEKLEKSFKKQVMDISLLNSNLIKMDDYINKNFRNQFVNKKRFLHILIARIYAKISLIIPIKTSEMLEIKLNNIKREEIRTIVYNGVIINMPNNLRKEILYTIDFVEKNFNIKYSEDDKLFNYLYKAVGKAANTNLVTRSFTITYNELQIQEMLIKIPSGKKNKYVYPPESYKITAIFNILNRGTNPIYLGKLTGLDINTLLSNYDFELEPIIKDDISIEINNGLVNTEYYSFL